MKNEKEKNQEMIFFVDEKFRKICRQILGTKPFSEVVGVIHLLENEKLSEKQINELINVLGSYPYDEVAYAFTLIKDCVKPINESEKEESKNDE